MKTRDHSHTKGRFDLRLDPAEKDRIQTAAALRGQKASVFAREVMLREADAIVAQHTTVALSAEESRRFMEALNAPFRANAKLAKALARAGG
ncbi:DUF1778 domain-containing protein [Montanilutibacter psychrotolerans]|uniref:DUF1778 domain-containing protein n=1 Tax=Montanilutibacter psychrotolerans TaxID=1327343 RepID=A0A3M8SLH7_9GAMM|nr:DUF1778 domain-containing protein [Lysobacter psychrotolerans]RNF82227.1 DUF1778 domain-containing protein [Lysobacter psychrotolerans]